MQKRFRNDKGQLEMSLEQIKIETFFLKLWIITDLAKYICLKRMAGNMYVCHGFLETGNWCISRASMDTTCLSHWTLWEHFFRMLPVKEMN